MGLFGGFKLCRSQETMHSSAFPWGGVAPGDLKQRFHQAFLELVPEPGTQGVNSALLQEQ